MKMILLRTTLAALSWTGFAVSTASAAINYDVVSVGDLGNGAYAGYGSVGYIYSIGKYEVTLTQYTEFLKAVAAADPNGLYNPSMGTDLNIAGIARTGSSGSYTYSVVGDGNRPVTYVSMSDAMRMANWMNNGQGNGSTETGAYTMSLGGVPPRNPGATVFLPNEHEWLKAGYYDPTLAGANKYWNFATRSGTEPGNTTGAGANQANYRTSNGFYSATQSSSYNSSQNYLTPVGAFSGSASYYGTYDQNGNVFEWNEGVLSPDRVLRGGGWKAPYASMITSSRFNGFSSTYEVSDVGFRLASVEPVPEPTGIFTGLLCLGLAAMRRRGRSAAGIFSGS